MRINGRKRLFCCAGRGRGIIFPFYNGISVSAGFMTGWMVGRRRYDAFKWQKFCCRSERWCVFVVLTILLNASSRKSLSLHRDNKSRLQCGRRRHGKWTFLIRNLLKNAWPGDGRCTYRIRKIEKQTNGLPFVNCDWNRAPMSIKRVRKLHFHVWIIKAIKK